MNKKHIDIAILSSGKTKDAIRMEFRRRRWIMGDETLTLYCDLCALERQKISIENQIKEISKNKLFKQC